MRGDGVAVARQQRRIEQALRRRVGAVLQARLEAGLVGETHGARELPQPRRRAASELVRRALAEQRQGEGDPPTATGWRGVGNGRAWCEGTVCAIESIVG